MDESPTPSKIDLAFAESLVVFKISSCSTHKDYSVYKLSREQTDTLFYRLKHVEKLTWKQLAALPREDGLTVEKPESQSYAMIDELSRSERKVLERYYFHMRIEKGGLFRIFGYQDGQCFCITHIDREGKIHH